MPSSDSAKPIKGGTLIVSNPGTGKTTSIANRVVELLESGVPEEQILCITFTEKAANEMRERVVSAVRSTKALVAAHPERISISTFHGYAYSYLQELGKDKEIASNNFLNYSIYRSFKDSDAFTYGDDYLIGTIVPKCANAIRYLKSFGILPGKIQLTKSQEVLSSIYTEEGISNISFEENSKFIEYLRIAFENYEREKDSEKKLMDYNDMLIRFIELYDPAKKHFAHVLVDELQDVNGLERRIAEMSGDSLFLVGDRKQSIFGFQGGSSSAFNELRKKDSFKTLHLKKNYRSLQGILDYSKGVFLSRTSDRSYADELDGLSGARKGDAKISAVISKDQAAAAVDTIIEMIGNSRDDGKRYAVITRTNGQIVTISRMLEERGIEHSSTVGGYTSSVAKGEMLAYLRGLLYDDTDAVIAALFTPFSGVTLHEAFQIASRKRYEKDWRKVAEGPAKGFAELKASLDMETLPKLFAERIIPISVSMGRDYYYTAMSVYSSIAEFFQMSKIPDANALFDFLAITEDEYAPVKKESRLTLTTVHKSKGLEFDSVVYVPVNTHRSLGFVDAAIYSIIKASIGRDVREELDEEDLRVDFVAFTRARDELCMILNDRQAELYVTDGMAVSTSDAQARGIATPWKYDEAYSLFLSGRKEESLKAVKGGENWLGEAVAGYFSSKNKLSYSLLNSLDKPYEFLKENILGIGGYETRGLRTGSDVHAIAEARFKHGVKPGEVEERYRPYFGNIEAIDREIREKYSAEQTDAEVPFEVPLSSMFGYKDSEGLYFKGKIDAVYKAKNGRVLILDWKTDKTNGKAGEHRRQLAVYKRAYSVMEGIDENMIDVALGFIGLKGNVNTGKLDYELDGTKSRKGQLETFGKRVLKFLEYRSKPEEFLSEVFDSGDDEPLFYRISGLIGRNPQEG